LKTHQQQSANSRRLDASATAGATGPTAVEPVVSANMLGRARGDSLVGERDVVFAAMSGPAAAPAEATNLPITDFISHRLHRLSGLFSAPIFAPESPERLEA
jgi:hypothetical protein